MTTDALGVLLAEDVPADAELCIATLKKAGFVVRADVCGGREEFEQLIGSTDYDVILADYNLRDWRGTQAIEIVRRLGKTTPVIVVTGILGDEKAVDCIHQGAADYVLKDRLGRLPSAVLRAIGENRLRGQSRLLAAAIRSVREGVVVVEAAPNLSNARIVSVNEALTRISGRSSEELVGKAFGALHMAGTGNVLADFEGLSGLDKFATEAVHTRKDGSVYDAEWQISPIRDDQHRVSHYVAILRDITDRKRTMAELSRSNAELLRQAEELKEVTQRAEAATRAKSDFLASMSHEIRTPLNAIIGVADLLSETRLTPQQTKYIAIFQRAGENLLVLINQLLDLSKIESGRFDLEQIDFDLNAVLARTFALFEDAARAKGLSLTSDVSSNIPTHLLGDPYQLQQVLTNLVGNAIKFTEAGSITVEANLGEVLSATECSIRFKVTDTGIGIPGDKVASIFETFTQEDSSITRRYGGTGLGLAISRALVERMKGNISVESATGAGSTFRFVVTLGLQSARPEAQSEPAPWRVLLCEDSQDNAFLVTEYLEGGKYVPRCASMVQAHHTTVPRASNSHEVGPKFRAPAPS